MNEQDTKQHVQIPQEARSVRNWLIFLAGLAVMSFGVAFSIRAELGTSPVSSVPYTLSMITPLSVGMATIIFNGLLILLQIVILRSRYQIFQLLQIPVIITFGYLCDLTLAIMSGVTHSSYLQQLLLCAVGILLVGTGVWLEVKAGVITMAGEGVVLAICRVFPVKFGTMKVVFDVSIVVLACLIGLVTSGRLYGVREGTLAAALCVGLVTKLLTRISEKLKSA